jgi:alcohol dehydrogenase class IV
MRVIRLLQPKQIVFGEGCIMQCADDIVARGLSRAFIVTGPPIIDLAAPLAEALDEKAVAVTLYPEIATEPAIATLDAAMEAAREVRPDAVIGVGGGSAMDTAKLVAALYNGEQSVQEVFGIGKLASRELYLACLPTTAGTGSEVSPNAILMDETEELKKGVVSPHLMPDAAYIDPTLTAGLPPALTAATGMDALTHCIESYANRFAHPIVDVYALQGIRLIGGNVVQAVEHGDDMMARTNMALGSMYGGLCLAPVNTAAVHALAYPLGGKFHVPHGISNAVLLPHVMRYNLSAAPERYAEIAKALGIEPGESDAATAQRGVERLTDLYRQCGVPTGLSELGIPEEAIPWMARSAMKVTRLLKNNLRDLTVADAEAVYRAAY